MADHDVDLARRRRSRMMRVVNVPMRLVLSLPVATPLSGRLMLAHITGRRTGRQYRQPLSYVRDGAELLTVGGGRWTANLLDGRPVYLRLKGRGVTVRPEVVRDLRQVETLLDRMVELDPNTTRFIPLPRTPDGHLEPRALAEAVAHGFAIVRWHPAAR